MELATVDEEKTDFPEFNDLFRLLAITNTALRSKSRDGLLANLVPRLWVVAVLLDIF